MLCYVYGEFLYDVSSCALADSLFVLLCFCACVSVYALSQSEIVCHCTTCDLLVWLQLAVAYRGWHARRLHYTLLLFIHKFWRNVTKAHTIETHSHIPVLIRWHAVTYTHTYNWFLRFSVFLIHIHGKYLHSHRHTRLAYDFPYDFE